VAYWKNVCVVRLQSTIGVRVARKRKKQVDGHIYLCFIRRSREARRRKAEVTFLVNQIVGVIGQYFRVVWQPWPPPHQEYQKFCFIALSLLDWCASHLGVLPTYSNSRHRIAPLLQNVLRNLNKVSACLDSVRHNHPYISIR